jgi:hypothetical protein
MAANFHQGDDIYQSIKRRKPDNTYYSLDDCLDVVVHVYSEDDPSNIIKFSKAVRSGYGLLTRDDAYKYHFWIDGAVTALMATGSVIIEIMVIDTLAELVDHRGNITGTSKSFNLLPSTLKLIT